VAGLVLDRLERIAEVGDSVVVDGMQIEVLEIEEFAITQVLLRLDPDSGIADGDDDAVSDQQTERDSVGEGDS
jgi:CBS domain containing-hemolysin-like protein